MSNLIVGTDACKVTDIVSALLTSESRHILQDRLTDIGIELDVYEITKGFSTSLILRTLTLSGALTEMFDAWKVKQGSDATLGALLRHFKTLDLIAFKQLLEKKFNVTEAASPSPAPPTSPLFTPMFLKQRQFIDQYLQDLIGMTMLHPMALAGLYSRGFISDAEKSDLDASRNAHDKNMKLYKNIIYNKPGSYEALIEVMHDTLQTGVEAILRKVYEQ